MTEYNSHLVWVFICIFFTLLFEQENLRGLLSFDALVVYYTWSNSMFNFVCSTKKYKCTLGPQVNCEEWRWDIVNLKQKQRRA